VHAKCTCRSARAKFSPDNGGDDVDEDNNKEAVTRRCELTSGQHNRFKIEGALFGRRIQAGSASRERHREAESARRDRERTERARPLMSYRLASLLD